MRLASSATPTVTHPAAHARAFPKAPRNRLMMFSKFIVHLLNRDPLPYKNPKTIGNTTTTTTAQTRYTGRKFVCHRSIDANPFRPLRKRA